MAMHVPEARCPHREDPHAGALCQRDRGQDHRTDACVLHHARDYREQYPGDHDPRTIYESWAIQKIAALQYTVLDLADAVAELQAWVRRQ